MSSVSNDITGAIASNNESQTRSITLPALANVWGTVTDRDAGNAAVPNADLYLTDSSCTNCYAGSTNASGQLLMSNVREGNYSVRIRAQDGRVASVGGVIIAAVDGQTIDKAASLSINDYTYGTFTFTEERQLYSVPARPGDVIRLSVNGYGLNGNLSAYIVRAQVYDPTKFERARGYGYDNRNSYSQYNELADLQNIAAQASASYTIAVSPYYDDEPDLAGRVPLAGDGERCVRAAAASRWVVGPSTAPSLGSTGLRLRRIASFSSTPATCQPCGCGRALRRMERSRSPACRLRRSI